MPVSIAMCTFNGALYIDEQLDSIVNQSYPASEIIVVDDASTDDTYSILLTWQSRHTNIKVYRNTATLGYNKNFEKAISLTTGKYISISDQDDIWLPEKNERLVAALEASPRHMLAHCRSARLKNGKVRYVAAKRNSIFQSNDTRRLIFHNQVSGHDVMFRKELVPLILPIPDKMFYDWWIAVIATTQGLIAAVDLPLVQHRIHDSNAFFTSQKRMHEPDRDEIIENFLTIPHLSPEARTFAQELLDKIKHQIHNKSSLNLPLLAFFLRHREIIFGHNKKIMAFSNSLKKSVKYAGCEYRGTGVH